MFRHHECVLPLGTRFLVLRDDFPAIGIIGIDKNAPSTHVDHRLDGKHHTRNEYHAVATLFEMRHVRLFMEVAGK